MIYDPAILQLDPGSSPERHSGELGLFFMLRCGRSPCESDEIKHFNKPLCFVVDDVSMHVYRKIDTSILFFEDADSTKRSVDLE